MMFTDSERRAFARHEEEQQQTVAHLSFSQRLAMLAELQRIATLFGHDHPPSWATQAPKNPDIR
jgi:hypothetical protein